MSPSQSRKPVRVTVTVPWMTHEALVLHSSNEGRSVSNLVSFLLQQHLNRLATHAQS